MIFLVCVYVCIYTIYTFKQLFVTDIMLLISSFFKKLLSCNIMFLRTIHIGPCISNTFFPTALWKKCPSIPLHAPTIIVFTYSSSDKYIKQCQIPPTLANFLLVHVFCIAFKSFFGIFLLW